MTLPTLSALPKHDPGHSRLQGVSSHVSAAVVSTDQLGVQIKPENADQCQRCQVGRGCGLGFFTSQTAATPFYLSHRQHGARDLSCGDSVILKLPELLLLRYVVSVLLVPATLIALSTLAGHTLALHNGYSAGLGGATGMLSGLLGGAVLARIAGNKLCGQLDQPLIVERCSTLDQD